MPAAPSPLMIKRLPFLDRQHFVNGNVALTVSTTRLDNAE